MAHILDVLAKAKRLKTNHHRADPAIGRCLGISAGDTSQIIQHLQKGFPYTAIVRFHKESGLPIGRIADLVRIPPRTLVRRKAQGRLQPEESERLLRVSQIFNKAVGLFEGDVEAARRWLATPSKELDNQPPLDFARTEIGARDVDDLIGRLEYGVFT